MEPLDLLAVEPLVAVKMLAAAPPAPRPHLRGLRIGDRAGEAQRRPHLRADVPVAAVARPDRPRPNLTSSQQRVEAVGSGRARSWKRPRRPVVFGSPPGPDLQPQPNYQRLA
jgi:hypothetical protein